MTITKPGVYEMPLDEYLADPCPAPSLSKGAVRLICERSAAHAYHAHPRLGGAPSKESSRADIGSSVHSLLFGGAEIHVVEADDWRTKAAREERDLARSCGNLPVLAKDQEPLLEMHYAAQTALEDRGLVGNPERTVLFRLDAKDGPVWLRTRPDLVGDGFVLDYKTASNAEPVAWSRTSAIGGWYDVQAWFQRTGVGLITGSSPHALWMVQEIEPPYAVSFIRPSSTMLSLAEQKVAHALRVWSQGLKSGKWPGYSAGVHKAQVLGWHRAELEARGIIERRATR